MKKRNKIIIAIAIILILTAGSVAYFQQPDSHHKEGGEDHEQGHEHGEGHEEHGDEAEISDEAAKNAGIEIDEVNPASIKETIGLTGKITLNQNKTAMVKARFPGVIRSVKKAQGDQVAENEELATVESNESLQVYSVKSPIAGVVLARNGSIGDVAGDQPMFTVSDISELWVELHIFAQDAGKIKAGQEVKISSSECEDIQDTTITAIMPVTENSSQTLLARAIVKKLDSHWLPGMSVHGEAVISSVDSELAVKTSAIQTVEGKKVVFVKEENEYHARNVETGAADDEWTEITSGLKAGEKYVSKGSFTVKAEIGKSEAEHSH